MVHSDSHYIRMGGCIWILCTATLVHVHASYNCIHKDKGLAAKQTILINYCNS